MSEICRNIGLILSMIISMIIGIVFLAICLFIVVGHYIIMIQDWIEDRKKLKKTKDKKFKL